MNTAGTARNSISIHLHEQDYHQVITCATSRRREIAHGLVHAFVATTWGKIILISPTIWSEFETLRLGFY